LTTGSVLVVDGGRSAAHGHPPLWEELSTVCETFPTGVGWRVMAEA
jgi:hypothetical protein